MDAPEKTFAFHQQMVGRDTDVLLTTIILGVQEDGKHHQILCIETEDMAAPMVDNHLIQQPNHTVTLESMLAQDYETKECIGFKIMVRGAVGKSPEENNHLLWTLRFYQVQGIIPLN